MDKGLLTRRLIAYLIATLVAFSLASILHTQFVLHGLVQVGTDIPIGVRLKTTLDDWVGMLPSYCSLIALAFAIAFPVTAGVRHWWPVPPAIAYAIAGFAAFMALLASLQPILDITLIAGSRGTAGFIAQCSAGALGGISYVLLNPKLQKTK